jgi:UDP-glucose 4-epimerase
VLRLSNAFGAPGAVGANCWDLLFNDLCRQVVLSGRIVLRSTGLQRRDFVPLTDVCSAIFHILQFPGATLDGRLFNIGGEWSPTVFEVANLVADRFELRCGVRPQISRPHPSQGETSQVLDYRIDALRNTGFKASTDRIAELDGLVSFCEAAFGSSRG